MALLFGDGFDHYGTSGASALPPVYWGGGSIGSLQAGRVSGFAARGPSQLIKTLPVSTDTLIVGFAFRTSNVSPGGTNSLVALMDAGNANVTLRIDNAGRLVACRGLSTILATSTSALLANVWYHIEFKVKTHASTGTFEVRVNGSSTGWINLTGQNTAGVTAILNQVMIVAISFGVTLDWDDFYVLDTTGPSPLNDFMGDSRIATVFPNANGVTIQWTPTAGQNFECVDNNPPADATFVSDSTPGNRDLYDFTDLANLVVRAVILVHRASKSDAGVRSLRTACRSGGSVFLGLTHALGTQFTYFTEIFTTDPNTGVAWTLGNFNAAQFGQDTV